MSETKNDTVQHAVNLLNSIHDRLTLAVGQGDLAKIQSIADGIPVAVNALLAEPPALVEDAPAE